MKREAVTTSDLVDATYTDDSEGSKNLTQMTPGKDVGEARLVWNRPIEYLLNVIGYTVGLGNVWRFSYLCYKNGGGAFLIPYLTSAILLGFPILFMETSLGQFTQSGCLGSWDLVPALRGVGYSSLIISWYFLSYIMVVMAWILFYLGHSITLHDLPWSTCGNSWNTKACQPAMGNLDALMSLNMSTNEEAALSNDSYVNETITSTREFWNNYVLRRTGGIHDMGSFTNWKMLSCFIASWAICYLCVWKGIRTTGKAAYVTVLSPYAFLLILLVRGAMLEGASTGVIYYIFPHLEKLMDPQVWLEAGSQALYTLGACFAVLYGLGSYNKFHTNCYRNAFICVGACCGTSVFVGFVLFCYLGHMAHVQNKTITDIAEQGPGLVFEVFPAGLTLLPVSQIWAVVFFVMLAFFAIDSAFGSIEGITRLLEDVRPDWMVKPGIQVCRMGMCVVPFILGLPMLFDGGIYVFELIHMYGNNGICILLVAFTEITGLAWVYGIDRFFDDIKSMIGYYPSALLKYCMRFADPCIILAILIAVCVQYVPLKLGDYVYPAWINAVGWLLILSVIAPIPIIAIKTMLNGHGSLVERWKTATTSKRDEPTKKNKVETLLI